MEKAAIYCRLSKEDEDKINQGDESASIQNQKLLLVNYAIGHELAVYGIYSDDDYSGLDSDRPDFKRMIKDAKNGCFNTIICKTQSRFTRDMELVEKYIHGLFPLIGVRFIGVVDNVDTDVKGNKKTRQINGLINEWYCEDLSENIRSVYKAKMEKGQFLGAYAPYGYMKDPKDKYKLIIDEEAAQVVRKIFTYFLQGYGNKQICYKLSEEKIPTPTVYKKNQGLNYENRLKDNTYGSRYGIWAVTTLRQILTNRMYIGDMVQGKQKKISYKSKKVVTIPQADWITVENCHEPIIDKEVFELVQKLIKTRRYARTKEGEISLLAGKVKCLTCGSTLTKINGENKYKYLNCQLYRRSNKQQCSPHSISYYKLIEILEERIKNIIKDHLSRNPLEESLFIENEDKKTMFKKKNELYKHQEKAENLKNVLSNLYIDKSSGLISESEYIDLKKRINDTLIETSRQIQKYKLELEELDSTDRTQSRKADLIRNYADFAKLDHELVNEFVEYIEVGEKDSENNQEVIIHWRF
ncbi:recombinase family protein [Anaerocolumna sp. AGMB13025]|uniref:recombinase family protein n=1 Tax=Anaerocolumna sp. AGMB13025 TaxID=3039116 RepID=UPI00241DBE41|nr:recombinase family protein [Anaerocolumna sp. AGMB13025]WFR59329.1 recombinase family protein [Anaerocolumna sp. AGMB13025]